jgi:hypothetical protein
MEEGNKQLSEDFKKKIEDEIAGLRTNIKQELDLNHNKLIAFLTDQKAMN